MHRQMLMPRAGPCARNGNAMCRTSLHDALTDVEEGALTDVSDIVASHQWWNARPTAEHTNHTRRCARHGIELRADDGMSRHFVEVLGESGEPPLSSEQEV